jgi:hypothetical protein
LGDMCEHFFELFFLLPLVMCVIKIYPLCLKFILIMMDDTNDFLLVLLYVWEMVSLRTLSI